jgi:hypothetical protein
MTKFGDEFPSRIVGTCETRLSSVFSSHGCHFWRSYGNFGRIEKRHGLGNLEDQVSTMNRIRIQTDHRRQDILQLLVY